MRVLTIALICAAFPITAGRAQTEPVGTFNRRSIVIAFYRSSMYAATLKERIAARDRAKRVGDTATVRALETWGVGQQEVAHRQLDGSAPITNILDALKPALDSIAKAAHLRAVIPATAAGSDTSAVDVTPALLDWLKADAKTRKIIADMPTGRS